MRISILIILTSFCCSFLYQEFQNVAPENNTITDICINGYIHRRFHMQSFDFFDSIKTSHACIDDHKQK